MRSALSHALGLLSLCNLAQIVRAEIEVTACMPPVKKTTGLASGKNLFVGAAGYAQSPDTPPVHLKLMDEIFGNSYGDPYHGETTLWPGCRLPGSIPLLTHHLVEVEWPEGPFEGIWIEMTIRSKGHQFDRLGTMWIGHTEIMRFTTPQPTDNGVVSYISKDLSQYHSLFSTQLLENRYFIFDLGNIVTDVYNAPIHVKVDAYFFKAPQGAVAQAEDDHERWPIPGPADEIIPISAKRGYPDTKASTWQFPTDKCTATLKHFPQNVSRAVLTVAATGQGDEEFWWLNVPQTASECFNGTRLPGLSSFREVMVLIDGRVAGFAWPFPAVFTGAISPALHRPIAGIQAFDLREYEIDLTPWLGVLGNGKQHTIRLEVQGIDDALTEATVPVGHHWVLSGKLFLWYGELLPMDETHDSIEVMYSPMSYKSTIKPIDHGAFEYTQSITREIFTKQFTPGKRAKKNEYKSFQKYRMINAGTVGDSGQAHKVNSKYTASSGSTRHGDRSLSTWFDYEIGTDAAYKTEEDSLILDAKLNQSMLLGVTLDSPLIDGGHALFTRWPTTPGSIVSSYKHGESRFEQGAGGAHAWGSTSQEYNISPMKDLEGDEMPAAGKDWYRRELQYKDNERIRDKEYLDTFEVAYKKGGFPSADDDGFEPLERCLVCEPGQAGNATDYAPFPLVRNGIPNIYFRD